MEHFFHIASKATVQHSYFTFWREHSYTPRSSSMIRRVSSGSVFCTSCSFNAYGISYLITPTDYIYLIFWSVKVSMVSAKQGHGLVIFFAVFRISRSNCLNVENAWLTLQCKGDWPPQMANCQQSWTTPFSCKKLVTCCIQCIKWPN